MIHVFLISLSDEISTFRMFNQFRRGLLDACDDMAMTSCIVACGEALQWPSALTLHRAVHCHDTVSYGASLSACEVAGEWTLFDVKPGESFGDVKRNNIQKT